MKFILIVMDSLGVGALPDANEYGDKGAFTFGSIYNEYKEISIPNLRKLGFCNIDGMPNKLAVNNPIGAYGRAKEYSLGKDTTTGHWEIAGIETKVPFKTYPNGFPKEFIKQFEEKIGRKVIGNYPASGTEIIEELGSEHERTGNPIVYTSADSVFQIAANIDVIDLKELYSICEAARGMLHGKWACGRVIARPYIIKDGQRQRTSDRRDYSVTPPKDTVLDNIKSAGMTVYAVGKINDIFNGKGITESVHTKDNMDGVDKTVEAIKQDFDGLVFTNLVDFDSKFGHRRNATGYGKAIESFDKRIPELLDAMSEEDIMLLCADHGNDPDFKGTDHTREYVPITVVGDSVKGCSLGTRETFADIGATVADYLDVEPGEIGTSFLNCILKNSR